MKRITMVAVAMLATAGTGLAFNGDGGSRQFRGSLSGLEEAAAVVSTTGFGGFKMSINKEETEISYMLSFENLEGDVRQAHIHIGWPQNSGGIVLWLCDSDANPSPSAATPACNSANPSDNRNGMVTGTLTEADVQNVAASGIAGPTATTPGEFAEVVALVKAGRTYVNVHTVKFPPGEIRSHIGDPNEPHFH